MPDLCMDVARARAVSHAVDPISFEDLRLRPTQVGALTCHGLRMEPALYHRSSVLDAEGRLRVAGHRSPTTHLPVDGFSPLPPLGEAAALAEFVDWDHDGLVTLAEVSIVLAALLPVDEERAERLLRLHFEVGHDGRLGTEAVAARVLPYCGGHVAGLIASALVVPVPGLRRRSPRSELLAWFDRWHPSGSDCIDLRDLRFAVARTLYKAFGDSVDVSTKEAAVSVFWTRAELLGEGELSRDAFIEYVAPAFQANLPQRWEQSAAAAPADGPDAWSITLHAPLEGEAQGLLEVQASPEDTLEDLCLCAAARWGSPDELAGEVTPQRRQLVLGGAPVSAGPETLLRQVPGMRHGALVQIYPMGGPPPGPAEQVPCVIA